MFIEYFLGKNRVDDLYSLFCGNFFIDWFFFLIVVYVISLYILVLNIGILDGIIEILIFDCI